ncbi:MAG: hypothetical protein K6E20_03980 [Acholeplasmatales bacterium]|nr:hypothetical protein [Acholeplasmatales bacterium]
MKKKIGFFGILSFAILSFASCTEAAKTAEIGDQGVPTQLVTSLNAGFTNETGTILDEDMKVANKKHYEIYLSPNNENSLFTVRTDITSYIKEKKNKYQKTKAAALQFDHAKISKSADLLAEMLDKVEDELFDDESIINTYLNVSFEIDLDDASLNPTLKGTYLYDFYKDNNQCNIYFDTVYMPLNVYKFDKENQPILRRYVFVPLYCEYRNDEGKSITKDGLVDTKFSSTYLTKDIVFSNEKKHYISID